MVHGFSKLLTQWFSLMSVCKLHIRITLLDADGSIERASHSGGLFGDMSGSAICNCLRWFQTIRVLIQCLHLQAAMKSDVEYASTVTSEHRRIFSYWVWPGS
jgi:hypothetical protein